MSINYVINGLHRTGGAVTVLKFAEELFKMGHEVSLTVGVNDKWYSIPSEISVFESLSAKLVKGFGVFNSKFPALSSILDETEMSILGAIKLSRVFRRVDINIATSATTVYPVLMHESESMPAYHLQHFETFFTEDEKLRALIRATYYLPLEKFTNSGWLSNMVFELTGERVPVLNPGILHEYFYKRDVQKSPDEFVIIALGKSGWKGAQHIIDAVSRVRRQSESGSRKGKDIVLWLYGRETPKDLKLPSWTRFFVNPSDDELGVLYSKSDIQITYSLAESFPSPPLEAMACGCAVISSPQGLEDYARDGKNCLVVDPHDVNSLVDAINAPIEDPEMRHRLGKAGVETAERFTYEKQAIKLHQLLNKFYDSYTGRMDKLRTLQSNINIGIV